MAWHIYSPHHFRPGCTAQDMLYIGALNLLQFAGVCVFLAFSVRYAISNYSPILMAVSRAHSAASFLPILFGHHILRRISFVQTLFCQMVNVHVIKRLIGSQILLSWHGNRCKVLAKWNATARITVFLSAKWYIYGIIYGRCERRERQQKHILQAAAIHHLLP